MNHLSSITDGFSLPTSIGVHGGSLLLHHDPNPNPNPNPNPSPSANPPVTSSAGSAAKKRRNLPGTPDPDAEVIALSPKTLMATNRFICEICNKGFQRDQNLQLHRRGHNLPWKLKQRSTKEPVKKKVYICPEKTCVHHDASRALGDLTGIKKHFSRKHGEKKYKCEKCSKKYAVQSDWKAHTKTCGTREYKCDCGTLFSRKDSFITHRAFCDALAEESARLTTTPSVAPQTAVNTLSFNKNNISNTLNAQLGLHGLISGQGVPDHATGMSHFGPMFRPDLGAIGFSEKMQMTATSLFGPSSLSMPDFGFNNNNNQFSLLDRTGGPSSACTSTAGLSLSALPFGVRDEGNRGSNTMETLGGSVYNLHQDNNNNQTTITSFSSNNDNNNNSPPAPMSATALLQKAAQMGSTKSGPSFFGATLGVMSSSTSSNTSQLVQSSTTHGTESRIIGQGGDLNLRSSLATQVSNLDQLMMHVGSRPVQPETIQSKTNPGSNALESGLTRDFLGMGGEGERPFLAQELANFASMSSAMGLTHFTSK